MKIFISQKVSGMDRDSLKEETKKITETLGNNGHKVTSVIDYPKEFANSSVGERLRNYAFKRMDEADTILAIIRGDDRSEGMLMEIGHILDSDKKIILAIQKEIKNTYLRQIANQTLEFDGFDDLIKQLKNLK